MSRITERFGHFSTRNPNQSTSHKWRNLSFAERQAVGETRFEPAILVKICDKGLGPALVSRSSYNSQLELHLRDITYVELTNTTIKDVAGVLLMHGAFQDCVRKF